MVVLTDKTHFPELQSFMRSHDIVISTPRLVFHLDIDDMDLEQIVNAFSSFVQRSS